MFGGVALEKGRTEKVRHIVVCIRKGCVYAAHVSRDLVGIRLDIYDFDGIFDNPSLEKQLKSQYKKDIEYKTDLLTEGGG